MGGPLAQRGASFGDLTRGLHDATVGLGKFAQQTRRNTETLITEQEHRKVFSVSMAEASLTLQHGRLLRDIRQAQGTGGSFAALARSQDRREDATLPFVMAGTTITNMIRSSVNNVVAAVADGVKELAPIKAALERIEKAAKDDMDGTTTDRLMDHLKGVARETREPKARRKL